MRFIFLITALFLASLNLRPVITSVSPMLGTIQEALGMSGSLASLLTSLPVLCMGFFAPAAVKLSNRWSIERTIAYCLLLIGAATAARYYVNSAWLMLLTAFLAGVGIAVIGPLLSGFIKKNFANPSAIVGIYSMALVVGAALGSGFSVPLQNVLHDSWQASIASWSILAVIALFFWWKPAAPKMPESNASAAVSSMHASANPSPKLPLNNKRAWLLTSFFGMMAFMFYSLTAWLPPMIEEQGYDKHTAGMILTLFTLIQIPVSLMLPILVSRFQRRAVWLIGCSVMELAGLLLLLLHFSPWLTCIFLGIGAGGLFPMALMLPIDESSNMEEANALSAMTQSGGYIFASLGPLYVGFVHDYAGSFPSAILSLMVIVAIMIGIQLKIGNRKIRTVRSDGNISA
ncbi:MFS transporter [Paenibacillus azoreducens]|uniref:MFS transporter n=1 Tax=Paenibacillus azoreducens TaxID=116718 RepID=A0A919YBR2_9BACL|nr:MFS transporter [Paenibacillus azoreducens]GIO46233.1 MFS transporter [Paenibacillus azoreducens]